MPDILVFYLKVFKQDNYYLTENLGCYNCAHMHLLNSEEMCLQLGRFACARQTRICFCGCVSLFEQSLAV